jgi:hypothetical protein
VPCAIGGDPKTAAVGGHSQDLTVIIDDVVPATATHVALRYHVIGRDGLNDFVEGCSAPLVMKTWTLTMKYSKLTVEASGYDQPQYNCDGTWTGGGFTCTFTWSRSGRQCGGTVRVRRTRPTC